MLPPPRHLLVTFVVCLLVTFSLASVLGNRIGPCLEEARIVEEDAPQLKESNPGHVSDSNFGQLLRSASPDVLHRLLHAYFPDRYKHGVYPSDQDALAAVHANNAPLATTLAQLAKRQDGGNSTGTPTQSDDPDDPDPTPDPDPDPDPDPNPDPTPTPDPGGDDDDDDDDDNDDDDQTANSNPPPTSNPPNPTPDPTPTDTPDDDPDDDDEPTTARTTRTPSRSASATTMTSTLPDGGVTVITSTSYYDVYPAEETDAVQQSASLQNAAPRITGEAALLPALLGVAVGGYLAV